MLSAAPHGVRELAACRMPVGEDIQQRRLTYPRLTDHEHHLQSPKDRLPEAVLERRELSETSHDLRRRRGRGRLRQRHDRLNGHKRHDQSVAAAIQRLDVPWLARFILQRVSQLLDAARQGSIANHTTLPYGAEQLLLADELTGVPRQGEEYLSRFQGELGDLTGTQQLTCLDVQPKRSETEVCLGRHRRVPRCLWLKPLCRLTVWESGSDTRARSSP